ncbi:hypothetical protein KIH86_03630 [Paenibacillus sp. HN-1]|uniref:hypothetical protein n=1 Tax=Paenibacillus TaxID=44249 RepID=UPI001CA8E6C4|nr:MULTISPECIES: hypothetical protein [Paenibacillus]MBY9077273.1 hypothetical protein [Paenibacillus sp. CGMCC 1.18879]MBY9083320.1 hypothetical protein [Paenibacillus sinensis]
MLTSLNRARSMMSGVDDSVPDFELEMSLEAASAAIERFCNRELAQQTHKQRIDGSGTKFLRLRNFPIHSVAEVKVCGKELMESDYVIESGNGILFLEFGWPDGDRNVEVEYLAGYIMPSDAEGAPEPTLPRNYELACILYAQTLLHQTPGVTSERVGDISVTYETAAAGDLPAAVAALIRL